jgi:hypothetical protein
MSLPNSPTCYSTIIVPTLQKADGKRLEKAVDELSTGVLTVALSHQAEGEIRALVKNGDGCAYTVALTTAGATCTCPDAQHRQVVCKHAVAVAFSVPRPTPPQQFPMRHLRWRSGEILCGAPSSEKAHTWPWPGTLVQWEETCSACRTTYQQGYNRTLRARKAEEMARRPQGSLQHGKATPQSPSTKAA